MNPVLDAVARRMGAQHHQHRPYRHAARTSIYTPVDGQRRHRLTNDYRGQAFLRPNVSGSSVSQSKSQMVNTYFAGYTFTRRRPTRPSAIWAATRSARRDSSSGIWRWTRASAFRETVPAAVPLGVLQRAEPHELRNSRTRRLRARRSERSARPIRRGRFSSR